MGTMQYSLTCCIVKYFNKVNIFLKKHKYQKCAERTIGAAF